MRCGVFSFGGGNTPHQTFEVRSIGLYIKTVKFTIDMLEHLFYYLRKRKQRGAIMTTVEKFDLLTSENKEIIARQIEILKESQSAHQSFSDSQE